MRKNLVVKKYESAGDYHLCQEEGVEDFYRVDLMVDGFWPHPPQDLVGKTVSAEITPFVYTGALVRILGKKP